MTRDGFVFGTLPPVPQRIIDLLRGDRPPSGGDLLYDQLDRVHGAGADLDLLFRSGVDQLAAVYTP